MNKRQMLARIEMLEAAMLYVGPRLHAGPAKDMFLERLREAAGQDAMKRHIVDEWEARLPGSGLDALTHAPAEHKKRREEVFGPDDA